jgi:blocked-early-in-transport protein 1
VLLQQEIDKSTNVLGDKVARIKEISMAIGDQVRSSNALLDDMEGDMGGVAGLLKGTMKRLEKLVESGGDRCFCYLIAFFIFVMLLLYWLATSSSPKQ